MPCGTFVTKPGGVEKEVWPGARRWGSEFSPASELVSELGSHFILGPSLK